MPKTYYDSELTGAQIESALEAIHGVVTPSNNGKVLCIVNGAISAKSASEWGHGAVLEPLSVTANGDYMPPTGTDGFDSVHVAVPSATLTTKSITQNGTYNASSDNADGYSSVTVDVQGGGSAVVQPLSVTQNGTYNPPSGVDGYAPVTVNVSGGGIVIGDNILSGASVPTANIGVDGDIYLQALQLDPSSSDYAPVEYIQATSDQYITTPLFTNQYPKIIATISIDTLRESAVFGGLWQTNGFTLRMSQISGAWRFVLMSGGEDIIAGSAETDTLYQIEAENGNVTINGTKYTGSTSGNASANLSIFRVTSKGSAVTLRPVALMKLFGFTAYSGRELVFAGVPVRNKNTGDAGLYDLVTDAFYGSVTSNKFIAGPDSPVGREVIADAYCKINGIWQNLIGTVINTGGTQ